MDNKYIILIVINCLFLLGLSFMVNNDINNYKGDVKELKHVRDSLKTENITLKQNSELLNDKIKKLEVSYIKQDSALIEQKRTINELKKQKKYLTIEQDKLDETIQIIANADSNVINSFRSKYFK